jgi:hypothetical protein
MRYSGAYFVSQFLTDPRLSVYGKWVAAYGPQRPVMAAPWDNIMMWQHANAVPYAGTNVDESSFFGSVEQLRSYGKPEPAKPSADGGRKGAVPRFLVTKRMMARTAPKLTAVTFPVQMVNAGAVLNGTGKQTAHWVQVVAGG